MAATRKDNPKPRLKNLDDLFDLNGGVNPLEQIAPILEAAPNSKRTVDSVSINDLIPFDGHPFRLYDGERLDDMAESIRANGVLVPIIVRRTPAGLVILAGHNRVNAANQAGLSEVPAIVLNNISDDDAMVYVIETNLIQRSFADMAHSEKAAVIALHHSKMFSQGKRNDILEQIKMLENPHEYRADGTISQIGTKFRTYERIGETYSLTRNTVARYLRIHQLISPLKAMLDNDVIPFVAAVTLSYLKEPAQELLADCMERHNLSVDMKKADALRLLSEKSKLNGDAIRRVLSGEVKPKPNRTPTVKIDKSLYAKYFKPNQSAKEVQTIVTKALELYFQQ